MKIASIYDFKAFPPAGGNHVHALQLIRGFQRAGHTVVTFGDSSVPGVVCLPRSAEGAEELMRTVDVLYVRIDANHVVADPLLVSLLERADLPMVWEINAPANEALAFSWLGGGRPVGGAGLVGRLDRLRRSWHARRQAPGIRREEGVRRRLAERVTTAVCVSSALARYAREGLGIPGAVVIPNGADHEAVSPIGPKADLPFEASDALRVLYAGSPIYPWQGMGLLNETIALCQKMNDPIRFVLLMNQAPLEPIESSNCAMFVKVPHHQVDDYVRACDVGVSIHPDYPWSPWGFHNSPMKVFDYMACAKPVVASNVGQLRDVIRHGENGCLFENSPEALRSVLLDIHSGGFDLRHMGLTARAEVEDRYNWSFISRQTVDILHRAVELHERSGA